MYSPDPIIALGSSSVGDGFSLTLLVACIWGQESIVQALIQKGVNVNVQTDFANIPLRVAVRKGNENITRMLVESKADTLKKYDKIQTMRFLLQRKVDMQAADDDSIRPIDMARSHPDPAVRTLFEELCNFESAEENIEGALEQIHSSQSKQ
ncbi:hypothetical protein TSTA_021300 [Talaromyces stipitatus ATCC 10500]|uniref:Uncharacterized protein n=1 Tax=Talaromyces stipitatus (strain ATCC 10500 / CBS 375.48 / QM 6759 / NRRL 1006) TaxID=441959 RepID=B8MH90_TALSN|nr:uncharacterized protein TSTA_021300 [Talaromyces stipitatus ATCC 10500]EED17069.1 hypothetical protein TSTA_021300 [Talaromyces stipitatus ATCC 10500]